MRFGNQQGPVRDTGRFPELWVLADSRESRNRVDLVDYNFFAVSGKEIDPRHSLTAEHGKGLDSQLADTFRNLRRQLRRYFQHSAVLIKIFRFVRVEFVAR
jgi:hypothetical protein